MAAKSGPVTQKFVTEMFARMDDDIHEMIAKPLPKLESIKSTPNTEKNDREETKESKKRHTSLPFSCSSHK